MIKQAIKSIAELFGGMLIITGVAFLITMTMMGKSPEEIAGILSEADFADIAKSCAMSVAVFIVTMMPQFAIHEVGHLIGGLLTGYRLVSFRIGSTALTRHGGRFSLRSYNLAYRGVQCIMAPPDTTPETMPYVIYNAGGIIANAVTAIAATAALLQYSHIPSLIFYLLLFTAITGFILTVSSSIPKKSNGNNNDAYTIMLFHRNILSRKLFADQMHIKAMLINGTRPKDIPENLFEIPSPTDYFDDTHVSAVIMAASRKLDTGDTAKAHAILREAESHRDEIRSFLVMDIESELLYTSLVLGDIAGARLLYTPILKMYITGHSLEMSSKSRTLCAVAMLMDGDEAEARRIYGEMEANRSRYMMQGEAEMDLALARAVIGRQ